MSAFLIILTSLSISLTAFAGTDVCSESFGPVLAEGSPSLSYFENLLKKGNDASLEEFMVLWYPHRSGEVIPADVTKECYDKSTHDPRKPHNLKSCHLDTVYSWGPLIKLKALQRTLPDDGVWRGPPNPGYTLDTVFSAISTFGYGVVPVRVKLKKVAPYNPGYELPIDNAKEIASWSFGTPEHYDEIIRDYLQYKSGNPWMPFWNESPPPLFMKWGIDGHPFTEGALKDALQVMIKMILTGQGRIYFSKGECRNRRHEFETNYPTYINPNPKSERF